MQGFLFSRPLDVKACTEFLARTRRLV
jgi:EAL domain-containing protein (putative c-di-GMP-specific phosphodiesterase class I)